MEYKKDKRIENLTLRDIHVGDWVQVWSEKTERYSPPLKIIQICDDGTIYLVTSDEERPTPWEENIKDVDALPITPGLLKGFGFNFGSSKKCLVLKPDREIDGVSRKIFHGNTFIGLLCEYSEGSVAFVAKRYCKYMHELSYSIAEHFQSVELEWKGLE